MMFPTSGCPDFLRRLLWITAAAGIAACPACKKDGPGDDGVPALHGKTGADRPKTSAGSASPTAPAGEDATTSRFTAMLGADLDEAAQWLIHGAEDGSLTREQLREYAGFLFGARARGNQTCSAETALRVFNLLDNEGKAAASQDLILSLVVKDGMGTAQAAYNGLPPGAARTKAVSCLVEGYLRDKKGAAETLRLIGSLEYPDERAAAAGNTDLMRAVQAETGQNLATASGLMQSVTDPDVKGRLLASLAAGLKADGNGAEIARWLEQNSQGLDPSRVGEAWVELLKKKETPVGDLAALVKVDGIGSGSRGTGLGYIARSLAERDPAEANQLLAALPNRQDQLKLATALVIETNPDKSIAFGDQLADAGVRDAYFERAARSYALDSRDAEGNPLLSHISDPALRQKTEAGIRETLKALEEQH